MNGKSVPGKKSPEQRNGAEEGVCGYNQWESALHRVQLYEGFPKTRRRPLMAERRRKDKTANSGISHFPLEEEQARQQNVHETASGRREGPSAGSRRGHRMSRQTDPPPIEETDERFEGRGGKGGKTGGSRAGLLSASGKEQNGRT